MWGCWSLAAEPDLFGEEDAAHPPAAQLPQDAVGIGEGGLETLLQLHAVRPVRGCVG